MPNVQEVEAAVGRDDATAVRAQLFAKFRRLGQRNNSAQHPSKVSQKGRGDKSGLTALVVVANLKSALPKDYRGNNQENQG